MGLTLNYHRIPVVQAIGASMTAIENAPIDSWKVIVTPKKYRPFDRLVASLIIGNSLEGDRINDGDWAVLRLNFEMSEIRNGDICAVLTPYGCLLKHLYLTLDDKVRLVSSNPNYKDILLDIEQCEIQGLLEEVIINFRK